jgi:DNA-binding CsgD family transcriptional regulator
MGKVEHVSHLIGDIYDAALDPALWPHVLEQTCGYVEGVAASIQSHDSAQKSAQFHFSWGDDPHYSRLYRETYVRINPAVTTAVIQTRVGEVRAYSDFISQDEYHASRFYKEWAGPQGYVDSVLVVLDKSATSFAGAVVMRHARQGLVDAETRRRMGLFAPHYCRAVAIGKIIDMHKVEAASLADTLDGLAAGAFLIGEDARIVYANACGHEILADGGVLQGPTGKLVSSGGMATNRSLQDAFAAAAAGDDVNAKEMAVPLVARNGEQWIAHVLPLTSGARRKAGTFYAAIAAVFVRRAAPNLLSPLEAIADAYRLTAAEMRVLMTIVNVGGVPEAADVLGISETTVKTHLQHVFEKTRTRRQADLIKLVATHMNPLTH